jgi:hypothetical protein
MIDRNDNNTSDTPRDWERYASLLKGLPERKLPEGFSARLNAAVPPRGAKASGGRAKMWWMIAPAATLATVLLVVWLGTANFSGDEVGNRSAVATSVAKTNIRKPVKGPHTSRPPRIQPVVPPTDFPAPPDVAVAPSGLDSMTGSLHDRSVSSQRAVTGAPATSYARGSMAVLVQ